MSDVPSFVTRAGLKLDHALTTFNADVAGLTCADLGCNAGGFTDCLLQRGATKVYAIDTGYGMLDYKLRKDARVVVMERTNALHVLLPETIELAVIDVAWTKQSHILPAAKRLLKPAGQIVTLIKPHYEAEASQLRGGVLPAEALDGVVSNVRRDIESIGLQIDGVTTSPIKGGKGNVELLALLSLAVTAT